MFKKSVFAVVVASVVLAGCGGGGHDPVASTVSFNLDAAVTNVMTSGVNFNLQASYALNNIPTDANQVKYGYELNESPTTDGGFTTSVTDSTGSTTNTTVITKRAVRTVSILKSGALLSLDTSTQYFTIGPFALVGRTDSVGNRYTAASTPLPTAAKVGQSGTLYTAAITGLSANSTCFVINGTASCPSAPLGTAVAGWTLEPDSASTAWACFTTSTTLTSSSSTTSGGNSGSAPSAIKECYRTDPAGNISDAKVSATVDGHALTFTSN